jgi:hypothetical protein
MYNFAIVPQSLLRERCGAATRQLASMHLSSGHRAVILDALQQPCIAPAILPIQ